jgi:phosphoribosylformylglycinamidine synthase II
MIHRIDVRPTGRDPAGEAVRQQIAEMGFGTPEVRTARIFLIDTDENEAAIARIAAELLADPVVEAADVVTTAPADGSVSRIEVHLKPGVMDPVAASTEMAIRDMGLRVNQVRTGRAYLIQAKLDRKVLGEIASRILANGVIETVHFEPLLPKHFPTGHDFKFDIRRVPLLQLSDDQLTKLSREGHLFLSLAEMKAIQAYFRQQNREPSDIELETLAQTWSEHCVHKTLKSAVEVLDENGKPLRRYGNLIKDTIFQSTVELMKKRADGFCLSVFKDNAGVIAFDDADAVCFKVETHNHPSAIEPYGGSATGAGGVIRDILGTGLGAKPIANTDVFCVAFPDAATSVENRHSKIDTLPRGVIHPKRILQQVVAGVRDYGNRMGIPTLNGAVYFDDRYLGNPLVFCGCVGLIPRGMIEKSARAGDAVVVMGGRTGRDGIHGATFSSAQLSDTHADEFSHAVQIGNAITEKKLADVILQARDRGLFTAVTDCGAGGLSSAVGEMGEKVGAEVHLERVPLKYAGLRYDEIWISEAQERMVLSVPQDKVKELLDLCGGEDVEATVIGTFGTPRRELILQYNGTEVGRLSMEFLHDGIPMPTRKAVVSTGSTQPQKQGPAVQTSGTLRQRLLATLAHPNVASKHWIIRQYDHEVQGGSIIKPLFGPQQIGPSDASVIRPKLGSFRGVTIACGLAPYVTDPYEMAIAAIDEAIRNAVCVGGDPSRLAMLDNFCWPSVEDDRTMGDLVRTCEACRDAALAYGVPFISGKDSLHNQFVNQETGEVLRIPNTLLISTIGVIDDIRRCISMDLKDPREGRVLLVSAGSSRLEDLAKLHRAVATTIAGGHVRAAHDVSDGGWLTAAAEMCIASGLGMEIASLPPLDPFTEVPGHYLLEVHALGVDAVTKLLQAGGASVTPLGRVTADASLAIARPTSGNSTAYDLHVPVDDLIRAWRGTLDW